MMEQRIGILVILTFSLLVTNCELAASKDSLKETSFESLYPDCSMNSSIIFLPLRPNYRFESYIILSYKNISQEQIAFPPGSGVKIFRYEQENATWLEVNNRMKYSSSGPYIVIDSGDGLSSYHSVVIQPEILENQSRSIRIAIQGHVYQEGIIADECVGAFMDIQP